MANRWLFAGSEGVGCFRTLSGTLGTNTTNAIDSGWCNTSLALSSSPVAKGVADFIDSASASDAAVTGEVLWLHFIHYRTSNSSSATNIAEVVNGSDQPWVAIRWKTGATYGIYYNSNTGASPTWTQAGSDFTLTAAAETTIDLKITLGSPHSVDLYLDTGSGSTLNQTTTFTQALFTSADGAAFTAQNSTHYAGSVLASVGISTIAAHCCNRYPTGAGATNTFTSGTYADVDDVGVNDADLMASATAAQKATFVYSDIPTLPSGYTIGDTFLYTRAKNDGSAPANLKPVRRDSGSTDNVGSSFSGMGLAFGMFVTRYSISTAEFNASQFGFESAT